jgi:tetratricopeptide (TPR) repeat protein
VPGHHQVGVRDRTTALIAAALIAAVLLTLAGGAAQAQEAIEIDPEAEEAFFRGVGLLEAGAFAAAVAEFELAVTLQPDFRRAYYYRARAAVAMQDWSTARQSAEAYSRFELSDPEVEQLNELIQQIDAEAPALRVEEANEASPAPDSTRAGTGDRRPDDREAPERAPTRTEEAVRSLGEGHALLEAGECQAALERAQMALSLDPGLLDALLLKGLARSCAEDFDGARSILHTYEELKGTQDPVAQRALERIEQMLAMSEVSAQPAAPPRVSSALGDDARIEGVLEDRWGDPALSRGRTRHLPGIGQAAVSSGRMELAGSRAQVEVARIHTTPGLVFSRLRVWGRSGPDTGGWYARAFAELYLSIVGRAGAPVSRSGLPDPRRPSRNSHRALAGRHRWEVTWTDDDGDMIVLRLGRCSKPGNKHPVVAENRPCLELVGSSGLFHPDGEEVFSPAGEAVRLAETPGRRSWDIDVGVGVAAAPGVIVAPNGGGTFPLGQFTFDLLVRFNYGPLTVGIGWAPGLGVTTATGEAFGTPISWFDSQITLYVVVRDRPRQPQWRSLMFGVGLVPDPQRVYGTKAAAVALSFRLVDQSRTTRAAGGNISIEPLLIFGGDGVVTIVPIRFTIGAMISTHPRLWAPRQSDEPRWH